MFFWCLSVDHNILNDSYRRNMNPHTWYLWSAAVEPFGDVGSTNLALLWKLFEPAYKNADAALTVLPVSEKQEKSVWTFFKV